MDDYTQVLVLLTTQKQASPHLFQRRQKFFERTYFVYTQQVKNLYSSHSQKVSTPVGINFVPNSLLPVFGEPGNPSTSHTLYG